jgi:hypothetical protein
MSFSCLGESIRFFPEFFQLFLKAVLQQVGRLDQQFQGDFPVVALLLKRERGFYERDKKALSEVLLVRGSIHGEVPFQ